MIIDLVKLGESKKDFELEIKPGEIDLESDTVELKDSAFFKGKLENKVSRVEIKGNINAEVEIACSRCLRGVSQNIETEMDSAFVTPERYNDEEEIELEIKDLDVSIFEGKKIDLKEVAREQILLALPTQILCNDSCKGLCQVCGENLNKKDCRCREKEVDPRWSALKDLKIKGDE